MHNWFALLGLSICVALAACAPPREKQADQAKEPQSIIGQKTQQIGEFDPEAGRRETVSDVQNASTPMGAALKAYGPTVSRLAKMQIDQALNLFYAEHERYPRDHEEFMERIIRANNISLPVLPGGAEYQYDVKNHKLVTVQARENPGDPE